MKRLSNISKRFATYGLIILFLSAVAVHYYIIEPSGSSLAYSCSIYQTTGMHCPGCGGQRALHYLLHGDVMMALRANVVYILGIPYLLWLAYTLIEIYIFKSDRKISSRHGLIVLTILMAFMLLRNLPFYPFTFLTLDS